MERIGTIAGASGGAKWLVLSQLDRVILNTVLPRLEGPVHLLGSSVGAWRFACYAQSDPIAAIERFETSYVEQRYSSKPDSNEITRVGKSILQQIFGQEGAREALAHPILRLHIMTVLSRNLTASDVRPLLGMGLTLAVAANFLNRRALGLFFSRALFFDTRDSPPFFDASGFPIHKVPLSEANLVDAVTASGAIPMVLDGVREIAGAPPGICRDGGIIDYHLDLPTSSADKITLYPHFFDWLKPGWFDRQLAWRKMTPANLSRTVLICPSRSFIENLPNQKVPDRTDFVKFETNERISIWRDVIHRCRQLADEFHEVLETGRMASRLQRL